MNTQRDLTDFATTAQTSEESSEPEPMTTNTDTDTDDSTDTTTDAYECELCGDQPAENRLGDGDTMLCDDCDEEAEGGRYDPSARESKPWSNYEPGDEVLLIEKPAVGLMCAPDIIEGSVSSSGKSVMIGPDEGLSSKSRRLDAETIMQGEWGFRDSTSYELYTPGRFRNTQRANHAPGPQAGANEVTDADGLPTPSHWPQTEQPDDAPAACPSCNRDTTHWQTEGKIRPMCEACGELLPEDDDQDNAQDETVEKWDLSRLDRGDVLTLDGHRGEFLLTRIHHFQGTQTVNRIDAATKDGRDGWTEYTLSKIDAGGKQRLRVDRDDTDSSPFVDVDDESHARDFEKIRQDTELLRRFINECYYGNDDDDRDGDGGQLVTDGGQDVEYRAECNDCGYTGNWHEARDNARADSWGHEENDPDDVHDTYVTEREIVTDGGVFEREADGTTWCPECQRRRVNCAHQSNEEQLRTDGSELVTDGGRDEFSVEELAQDASEPRRQLGNALTNLWDIDRDGLTSRESARLSTILGKIDELESIIQEREERELRDRRNGGEGA